MRLRTAIFGLLIALPPAAAAHDIPNDVTVQMFLHPSSLPTGDKLDLLVRVPLKSMRDIDFPKLGPGYLDLSRADQFLRDAATVWLVRAIEVDENDARLPAPRLLAVRPSLESDKSFASYETALAHIAGPKLPEDTEVAWDQVMLDAWLQYPIRSDRSEFSIRPNVDTLGVRVITVLRFLPQDGAIRAFEFEGDEGLIRLDPRWYQASLRFVRGGFLHILDGTDHLLFLLCLVIPFRQFRQLLLIVTSFTVAHSFTLITSAYGLAPDMLWFPPLIETLIAMSIVYMALENIVGANSVGRRWMVTFGFGLVHGFGFSFALRQTLQFAGSHLLTSLVSFNLGVELGQMLVLAVSIPLLNLLFRYVVAERMGTIILSALVAHTAWHWMVDRWGVLRQFPFPRLVVNAAFLATAMRWAMIMVALAGLVWLVSLLLKKRSNKPAPANVGD
jgi:HupE / UreJ protein